MNGEGKTYFNWSTGKDSALALYYCTQLLNITVDSLLTSVNSHHNRVSMHGVRRYLLKEQAEVLGIRLNTLELPEVPNMAEYNSLLTKKVKELKQSGYTQSVFGDIFLEDLKSYREQQLSALDIQCLFPLWKKNTLHLINEFIQLGFKAVVVSINAQLLPSSFAGREIDESFINDLPENVDPCGENGEFHTFCYDGPIFNRPVNFELGEKIYKEYRTDSNDPTTSSGYWFCDLIPTKDIKKDIKT